MISSPFDCTTSQKQFRKKEEFILFFRGMTKEYQNVFRSDSLVLFHLVCDLEVAMKQMSEVKQHLSTAKHLAGLERKGSNGNDRMIHLI